jgi:hypothetical protein
LVYDRRRLKAWRRQGVVLQGLPVFEYWVKEGVIL